MTNKKKSPKGPSKITNGTICANDLKIKNLDRNNH